MTKSNQTPIIELSDLISKMQGPAGVFDGSGPEKSEETEIKGRLMLYGLAVTIAINMLKYHNKLRINKDDLIKQSSNDVLLSKGETDQISYYMLELSIIYFCQMFNSGYQDAGIASENNQSFKSIHHEKIFYPIHKDNDSEKIKWEKFCEQLKTIRDKMIGHADAEMSKIQHRGHYSLAQPVIVLLREVDTQYMLDCMTVLNTSIMDYTKTI